MLRQQRRYYVPIVVQVDVEAALRHHSAIPQARDHHCNVKAISLKDRRTLSRYQILKQIDARARAWRAGLSMGACGEKCGAQPRGWALRDLCLWDFCPTVWLCA